MSTILYDAETVSYDSIQVTYDGLVIGAGLGYEVFLVRQKRLGLSDGSDEAARLSPFPARRSLVDRSRAGELCDSGPSPTLAGPAPRSLTAPDWLDETDPRGYMTKGGRRIGGLV